MPIVRPRKSAICPLNLQAIAVSEAPLKRLLHTMVNKGVSEA